MRTNPLLACIVAIMMAFPAVADTYRDCETAVAEGDINDIIRFASRIVRYNNIPAQKQESAAACVSAHLGEPMTYFPDRDEFLPTAEYAALMEQEKQSSLMKAENLRLRICELRGLMAETSLTLQRAEDAQQDRRIETVAATVAACRVIYEREPEAALTNNVCNSIFASGGLPNSDITGPSASETLLAELRQLNANAEQKVTVLS